MWVLLCSSPCHLSPVKPLVLCLHKMSPLRSHLLHDMSPQRRLVYTYSTGKTSSGKHRQNNLHEMSPDCWHKDILNIIRLLLTHVDSTIYIICLLSVGVYIYIYIYLRLLLANKDSTIYVRCLLSVGMHTLFCLAQTVVCQQISSQHKLHVQECFCSGKTEVQFASGEHVYPEGQHPN